MTTLSGKTIDLDAVEDIDTAYPLLVDNIDASSLSSSSSVTDLGGQAGDTISKVLSWRGRPGDAAGFQAALKASFSLTEDQGHVVSTYTPRALSIQAGLGALTGAQASLYARAQAMQTLTLTMLDGLSVLDPAADLEDVEALRRLVRESVLELVAELGTIGGPRIPRVNTLFTILTGIDATTTSPPVTATAVGGQLGQLRDRFGLLRVNVNDLDDEQVLTSFYTIVDSVASLQASWVLMRVGFSYGAGDDEFIGNTTTKLSWALAAAAAQLKEVRFLLGSVFLRDAELQTILVTGSQPSSYDQSMPLSDLLSWLEDFLVVRGPRLVAEAGRDGIAAAFAPMAKTLADLVTGLTAAPGNWPKGMSTIRVRNGFSELATYLNSIVALVGGVTRYGVDIESVTAMPITERFGDACTYLLAVTGEGFLPEHTVVLNSGTQTVQGVVLGIQDYANGVDGISALQAIVTAPDGPWTLTIIDGSGRQQAWCTVVLPPTASGPGAPDGSDAPDPTPYDPDPDDPEDGQGLAALEVQAASPATKTTSAAQRRATRATTRVTPSEK
jgi:hypothetical protein